MREKKRERGRKGQVSMEYLMVTAFAFLLSLPLIGLFYTQSAQFKDDVTASQVDKVVTEIVNAADEVYYLGEPSKKTLRVYFPNTVKSVQVSGKDVTFRVDSSSGDYDIYRTSVTNLTGSIEAYEGVHEITVRARANDVRIEET